MKKFVVITSILEPSKAVLEFSKLDDWQLVVVGDKKTPPDFNLENVIYLSPKMQTKLFQDFSDTLPWNSYSRKNIGFLYAIKLGADVIAESDDDNIPLENWGKDIVFDGKFDTVLNDGFVNIFKLFTKQHIWPRGYPLDKILDNTNLDTKLKKNKVGIWQFMVEGEPDVDAIYRLTNNSNVKIAKDVKYVLGNGVLSPFNSQNTFFTKEMFPLLFLPPFVTMRFTDILRGLVAQPIMWSKGFNLGFASPSVKQVRNYHNFLNDFELEIPVYLYSDKIVEIARKAVLSDEPIADNIMNVYESLLKAGIVERDLISSLELWLRESA